MSIEAQIKSRFGDFRRTRGRNGLEYVVRCCFCGKKRHLYINPSKEVYNCYHCNKAGPLSQLMGSAAVYDIQMPEAAAVEPPKEIPSPGQVIGLSELADDHPAIRYLTHTRKRKFDPGELQRTFGVGYCVHGRRFNLGDGLFFDTGNTLVFPVYLHGVMRGWQSRLLYEPKELTSEECRMLGFSQDEDGWMLPPKYFTSPGMRKSGMLYNFDVALRAGAKDDAGRRYVVVTEGVFDAMSVGPFAVAAFGKKVSEDQEHLLASNWDAVYLMLDPGDATQEMEDLSIRLSKMVPTTVVQLVGYKDPGDAPRAEIWRQLVEVVRRQRMFPAAAVPSRN